MTLMSLLVDFTRTGRIGPLRCGMPLSEAEGLLGPGRPHPAIRLLGPGVDGYPYAWGGLELVVTRHSVSGLWIRLSPGAAVRLPPLVLPDSESYPSTVLREELIAGLDAVGCRHDVDDLLTFGEQSSVLTRPAGVCAVFFPPRRGDHVSGPEQHCLGVLHKRDA
ncbi:hypothetical protein [Streptomyces cinereoruber]|uniref:hypothetical protein n=1 Tax=Streptomyces cinereoruber TaxID=67260 RepID=UPI003635D504